MSVASATKTLGVIGLGSMGFGAAASALRRGVTVWGLDTRAEACGRFEAEGGRIASSRAELGAACDAVLVLVVNAAQTEQVLFADGGLASSLKPARWSSPRRPSTRRCRPNGPSGSRPSARG